MGKIFTLMWALQVICHRIRSAEKTQQPPITYNSFIADYKWIRRKPCVCAKLIILILLLMMLVVITMMIIFIQSLSKCMSFVFANSPPMKTNLRATVANNVPPSPDNPRYFIKTRSPFPDNLRYFIKTAIGSFSLSIWHASFQGAVHYSCVANVDPALNFWSNCKVDKKTNRVETHLTLFHIFRWPWLTLPQTIYKPSPPSSENK